ncbi:hypothetical protein PPERSA_12109 [Pseudocohnilembus persalinus]|uniref:EH domain-containing protein n=1 Tax=Pseudocohnilembus persalinus TaxID=266149 RepID=A0A0V0QPG5_PSEPJ|nr:hypothetical protein PPERSA_12109 [Pseudocohnilembus persalinus]|eukprot:KRX03904.1 hypothetical protein PPERSA_12109 [Pseudocohnilembus persalinus]
MTENFHRSDSQVYGGLKLKKEEDQYYEYLFTKLTNTAPSPYVKIQSKQIADFLKKSGLNADQLKYIWSNNVKQGAQQITYHDFCCLIRSVQLIKENNNIQFHNFQQSANATINTKNLPFFQGFKTPSQVINNEDDIWGIQQQNDKQIKVDELDDDFDDFQSVPTGQNQNQNLNDGLKIADFGITNNQNSTGFFQQQNQFNQQNQVTTQKIEDDDFEDFQDATGQDSNQNKLAIQNVFFSKQQEPIQNGNNKYDVFDDLDFNMNQQKNQNQNQTEIKKTKQSDDFGDFEEYKGNNIQTQKQNQFQNQVQNNNDDDFGDFADSNVKQVSENEKQQQNIDMFSDLYQDNLQGNKNQNISKKLNKISDDFGDFEEAKEQYQEKKQINEIKSQNTQKNEQSSNNFLNIAKNFISMPGTKKISSQSQSQNQNQNQSLGQIQGQQQSSDNIDDDFGDFNTGGLNQQQQKKDNINIDDIFSQEQQLGQPNFQKTQSLQNNKNINNNDDDDFGDFEDFKSSNQNQSQIQQQVQPKHIPAYELDWDNVEIEMGIKKTVKEEEKKEINQNDNQNFNIPKPAENDNIQIQEKIKTGDIYSLYGNQQEELYEKKTEVKKNLNPFLDPELPEENFQENVQKIEIDDDFGDFEDVPSNKNDKNNDNNQNFRDQDNFGDFEDGNQNIYAQNNQYSQSVQSEQNNQESQNQQNNNKQIDWDEDEFGEFEENNNQFQNQKEENTNQAQVDDFQFDNNKIDNFQAQQNNNEFEFEQNFQYQDQQQQKSQDDFGEFEGQNNNYESQNNQNVDLKQFEQDVFHISDADFGIDPVEKQRKLELERIQKQQEAEKREQEQRELEEKQNQEVEFVDWIQDQDIYYSEYWRNKFENQDFYEDIQFYEEIIKELNYLNLFTQAEAVETLKMGIDSFKDLKLSRNQMYQEGNTEQAEKISQQIQEMEEYYLNQIIEINSAIQACEQQPFPQIVFECIQHLPSHANLFAKNIRDIFVSQKDKKQVYDKLIRSGYMSLFFWKNFDTYKNHIEQVIQSGLEELSKYKQQIENYQKLDQSIKKEVLQTQKFQKFMEAVPEIFLLILKYIKIAQQIKLEVDKESFSNYMKWFNGQVQEINDKFQQNLNLIQVKNEYKGPDWDIMKEKFQNFILYRGDLQEINGFICQLCFEPLCENKLNYRNQQFHPLQS